MDILNRAIGVNRHNDWIEAYYRIALLRLGDASQLQPLTQIPTKDDWNFDLAGVSSWYHRLKPLLKEAVKAAAGVPSDDLWRTALNFASAERDRYLAHQAKRERKTLEIRWDLADALARAPGARALNLLSELLADDDAGVRLRAASALLQRDEPAVGPLLVRALSLDYGGESGQSRNADIRAAELRKLLTDWPTSTATKQANRIASRLPEPSVRFLAIAAAG